MGFSIFGKDLTYLAENNSLDPIIGRDLEIQRVSQILEIVGLPNFEKRRPETLSGGQKQRIALARALAPRPSVLLLDEPFVSLDFTVANRLRNMLVNIWQKQKTTIIFVTHDLREAIFLGDRILFLSEGPSKVIYDYKINLDRPRDMENKDIENIRNELIKDNPSAITGVNK